MSARVWYASYGSNMSARRFGCYLQGGSLPGMARVYTGARDTSAPAESRPAWLDGSVYFALESKVWTGGMAFLDPEGPGRAAGRAYLITVDQFTDVVAQEMSQEPGSIELDLGEVLNAGRLELGPGRYETLVVAGAIDGIPALTFTAPQPQRPITAPSAAYLRMLGDGLIEAHAWSVDDTARYLAELPGAHLLGETTLRTILLSG